MLDARIPDGLTDVRQGWILDDIVHGHEYLDELDAKAARDAAKAAAEAARRAQGRLA